jgi:hypothetical protein
MLPAAFCTTRPRCCYIFESIAGCFQDGGTACECLPTANCNVGLARIALDDARRPRNFLSRNNRRSNSAKRIEYKITSSRAIFDSINDK